MYGVYTSSLTGKNELLLTVINVVKSVFVLLEYAFRTLIREMLDKCGRPFYFIYLFKHVQFIV